MHIVYHSKIMSIHKSTPSLNYTFTVICHTVYCDLAWISGSLSGLIWLLWC